MKSVSVARNMPGKVYFIAKTRHSPPGGPIALGNIISDPRSPEIALNSTHASIARKLKVHETVEIDQSRRLGKHFSVQPTVWAKFVQGAGFGDILGEASIQHSTDDTSFYKFEKIVTREISPDLEAVRGIFNDPQVQGSIKERRWQLSVFMITGVQIAYGAEMIVSKAKETGVHLQTGVDLTPVVAPVSVGIGLNVSTAPSQGLSTKYTTPFVFSYRVRQIIYRRKKVEQQREYMKGDLLAIDEVEGFIGEQDAIYEAQLRGLAEEDEYLPGMLDLQTEGATTGDDEQCIVVFTTPDSDDSDD